MRKIIFIVSLLVVQNVFSQGSFSFYQLRNIVPQTQSLTAAYMPENKVTVSVPALNSSIFYVGGFRAKDVLVKQESGNLKIDIDNLYTKTEEENYTSINFLSNLFHVQVKTKVGSFSLFSNAKASGDIKYTDDLIKVLAEGNSSSVGKTLNFEEGFNFTSYKEIGLGYSVNLFEEKLLLGIRFKYLNGAFHASTKDDASFSLYTDPVNYNITFSSQNLVLNSAGIDLLMNSDEYEDGELESYTTWSDNHGFAVDFGAAYDVTERLNVEFSINDIGYINWKEYVNSYNVSDNTHTFTGPVKDIKNTDDIGKDFEDEIDDEFGNSETNTAFKSNLTMSSYLSTSYKFGKKNNNRVGVTAYNRFIFNKFNPSAALSYNHFFGKKTTIGVVSSFVKNKDPMFGVNLATNLGPIQFYFASDNLIQLTKPEEIQVVDFKFGFNVMVGYGTHKEKKRKKEEETKGI